MDYPSRNGTGLEPVELQGVGERETPARPDQRGSGADHVIGDEVQRADLVVVPPATPVAHLGGDVEHRLRIGHRQLPMPYRDMALSHRIFCFVGPLTPGSSRNSSTAWGHGESGCG